jgi:hypothetical protein
MFDPNSLSPEFKYKLNHFVWGKDQPLSYDYILHILDLHALGVHFWTSEYLPSYVEPEVYAYILSKGLTPPMALPIWTDESTQAHIEKFLNENYHKLHGAGIQYLGNEVNIQPASAWDNAKLKVCMCRMSPYRIVDGSAGSHLVSNFITDYTDDIFIDFSFFPETSDISKFFNDGIPWLFGNTTKRPLIDFDIVIIVTTYQSERVHIPAAMVKSGIPLYHWERWDESLPYYKNCPIVLFAGIGSVFIENLLGDNPIKGVAENAAADLVLIGEGEMLDLKLFQHFINVREDGGSKRDFIRSLDNERFTGVYDPTKFLFTYADKISTEKDFTGRVLSEKVFKGGGNINGIYLIDEEAKTLHCMAGRESEEFQDMVGMHNQYHTRLVGKQDPSVVGRHYVKIGASVAEREAAGFKKIDKDTQQIVMEERKRGITRVEKPKSE